MRRLILISCLLLSLGAGLVAAGLALAARSTQARPAVAPELILHRHTVTVVTSPPNLGTVRLRVYPAVPGRQRVELTLPPRIHVARITLQATMAGMTMPPVRGIAIRQGRTYHGTLDLAMFGQYHLQVRVPGKSFMLRVVLPLPTTLTGGST